MGYLPQNALLNIELSIYNELLTVFKDLIALENNLRTMEAQMNEFSGSQLDELINKYTNATDRFEKQGGLQYKSELIDVLKGLGFTTEDFDRKLSA